MHYDATIITFSEAFSAWSSGRSDDIHWGAWPNEDISSNWGLHCGFASFHNISTLRVMEEKVKLSPFRSRWVVVLPPGDLFVPPRSFKIVDIIPPVLDPDIGSPRAFYE